MKLRAGGVTRRILVTPRLVLATLRRSGGVAGRILATLPLVLALLLATLALAPRLVGFRAYVVDGGSMGSAIPRGSLVLDEQVPTSSLALGDVITYTPPLRRARVTHRIVWVGRDRAGLPAFRTKGDANAAADPWRFTLARRRAERVALQLPIVGYAYAALALRPLRIAVIGLPALVIALAALGGLRREIAGGARG